MSQSPFYTAREVGRRFRVDPKTVHRWIRAGKFKNAIKTPGGGSWLINREEVDRLWAEMMESP